MPDHTRPMSCATDLSSLGLPPIAEPTIEELQAEIKTLKARASRQEELFFRISGSLMSTNKLVVDKIVEISMRLRQSLSLQDGASLGALKDLSGFGLTLIEIDDNIRRTDIRPNADLLPQDARDQIEAIEASLKP